MRFNVLTLFPELIQPHLEFLPFKRAVEKNAAEYKLWNLRDYALDKRGTVDDKPFGGGTGMLLMPQPIYDALNDIHGESPEDTIKKGGTRVILLSPRGKKYNQKYAEELTKAREVTLICGRYEGVDARVEENYVTDIISIGDYVLSGGEVPALTILESVTRLLPQVIEKEDAVTNESFSNGSLEYPQYTRPEIFKGKKVPDVLLSGNHKEIEKWKKDNSPDA
ncbi:tRNA (guanosine(37)-N1)-methyltransferase TrmD [candidate division WWE3 bacterium RIFOXYD1_FULL_43_17]|uniref:tRNA (guanine-N(1)-)-methyltransferase n=1 Tax=candidate division WWE3 bacterium RIFOXYD1_FULL_43_17 TaxID=1802652 RepID=A0A1F4XD77_UNCKA|nr:MAG: tRNA (guanosine(37)-N1)-methyltransferase TrmD [candidate division WWE3 bacterium RIFOXYD1_FULL_43_17]